MSLLIHYRCHHCGAAREGGSPSGWIRCQHCDVIIGFDFQAWLGSAAYAAYLREASSPRTLERWKDYQVLFADAVKQGLDGLAAMERAAELMLELSPITAPPESLADPPRRSAWRRFLAFFMLMQQLDVELSRLSAEVTRTLAAIDFARPLQTLEAVLPLLERQGERLVQLGPPDDPDGLPWPVRQRVWQSQFLTAYVQLLSREEQRAVLARVWGVSGDLGGLGDSADLDDLGLFLDFACPACGLHSLQAKTATELTCPGCMFRTAPPDTSLPALSLPCPRCRAPITLEPGARERACSFCQTLVRRLARTGQLERDFANEVKADIAARHGLTVEALPPEGRPGLAVTPENRRALQLTGLARIAAWYGSLVSPARIRRLAQRTFGAPTPALIAELTDAARADGNSDAIPALQRLFGG